MPLRLSEFLGEAIPTFIETGDVTNIGTGRADVDIVRMLGGGWYDNQGDEDSPRALDPITKSGMIFAHNGLSVRTQVEALRARLGARGRLDLLWHDGSVRWIWARFTSIRTPRGFVNAVESLPVDMAYMPVGGFWYGDTLTVATSTWTTTTSAANITVTNAGNANVVDAVITYTSPHTGFLDVTLENYETAQKITLHVSVETGWSVVVDVGQRTVKVHELARAIASISRSGAVLTVATSGAHGYIGTESEVLVKGTDYDGVYRIETVVDTTTLELAADPAQAQPHGPQVSTGTILRTVPVYSNSIFSDKAHWLTLVPGANTIHVESVQDMDDADVTFEFYATYA